MVRAAVGVAVIGLLCATVRPVAQDGGGVIEGRITFEGRPPPHTAVIESGSSQPVLYVDSSGGLQHVAVFLPDARSGSDSMKPPATMNQRQFIFEPQVLTVQAGQPVRFTNDDPANHNVRSADPNRANAFNLFTGTGAMEPPMHRFVATPPNRPVQLSCDIHSSMVAWIYVFDHAPFATTDERGHFRINRVPPGRHWLSVRQPAGKLERDLSVEVKPGEMARIDVRFTAADVGVPSK